MGLNSTYIITIEKQNLQFVDEFLKTNCKLNNKQMIIPTNCEDKSLILEVEVDSWIKKYIRSYYWHGRFSGDYQDENLNDRIQNGKTTIGGVELYKIEFGNKINLNFVCVSSSLSQLFSDSDNIRNWFVKLCEAGKAETGIFDCENEYFQLFWLKNKICNLQINPEFLYDFKNRREKQPSLKPMNNLILAAYDYTYKHKR